MALDPESIDLAEITAKLLNKSGRVFLGVVMGRTAIRDEVAAMLNCSLLEAEQLVDTLIGRGFIVRQRPEEGPEQWVLVNQ